MNKHKEFIKKSYNGELGLTMCSEWKEAIEKQYPEFKTKLEVGRWYKNGNGLTLFLQKDVNNSRCGFNSYGKWSEYIGTACDDEITLATKEEVEKALINEAKRRGFKEGVVIKTALDGVVRTLKGKFLLLDDTLVSDESEESICYPVIFNDGKWAEIIETITKEEAEKQLGKKIV